MFVDLSLDSFINVIHIKYILLDGGTKLLSYLYIKQQQQSVG